jgi:predicted homoserine dehydrogenase-like protein
MSLYDLLTQRASRRQPVRVGVIGAGTFIAGFLSQSRTIPGLHVAGVADLDAAKARTALMTAGWPEGLIGTATSSSDLNDGYASGKTMVTESADDLLRSDIEVMIEATGITEAGAYHASTALEAGKHVVMANVEADVLVGPLLKKKADRLGLVYSMAFGDQPAIISEMVDWARTIGLEVVCAGKGTRYQPEYRYSTPDTVWDYFGFSEEVVRTGNYNPQMYNSFLDSTKSAIEMCALCNATGLIPQEGGLHFPPVSPKDLPNVLKPAADGGMLERSGTVEIVASEYRDGTPVENHLRWGVYLVFKAGNATVRRFLSIHDFLRDESGEYGAVYRPFHLIGLELSTSVASAVLRREATGAANGFIADVATVAKKDLKPGEVLDGEGGFMVFGQLVSADDSLTKRYLPLGLSRGARMTKPVAKDSVVTYDDAVQEEESLVVTLRRELEDEFRTKTQAIRTT